VLLHSVPHLIKSARKSQQDHITSSHVSQAQNSVEGQSAKDLLQKKQSASFRFEGVHWPWMSTLRTKEISSFQ
jgi:hypothetical protein